MNRTRFLLGAITLSLAASGVMLVALAMQPSHAPARGRNGIPADSSHRSPSPLSATAVAAVHPTALAATDPGASSPKLWSLLRTDDLKELLARLRTAGFPPLVIRSVISGLLEAKMAQRADEIFGPVEQLPYWAPDSFTGFSIFQDPKKSEAVSQLYRDYSRQLRELFGDDIGAYTADPTAEQRRRFGDLSSAKIDAVQRIVDDYEEMMSQLRTAGGGITLPEDREKLRLLEQEKKADLAGLLTPEERADYEMRNDPMMWRLRPAMTLMDANEDEFRAIFLAQRGFEDRLRALRPSEAQLIRGSAEQASPQEMQLQQEIQAALGPQRYAEYSRAMNFEFQRLIQATQRENIPSETAVRVFGLRDGVAQESNRIYNDGTLTFDQKRIALQSLALQTRNQILSTLGPSAGPEYVQAARWLTLVERGSAVSFGPEFRMSSKKLPDPPKQ